MADAIKDEAADDPDFAKLVDESAARVVAMKERRRLAHCSSLSALSLLKG